MELKWIKRFLLRAREVASHSKDPSTKVGAVAYSEDRELLSEGYNGFPRGFADTEVRLNDREFKYEHVVHAEKNCIYNAARIGRSLKGAHMFVWGLPVCVACSLAVVQAGIIQVHMAVPDPLPERWRESWCKSKKVFDEVGIGTSMYIQEEILK
jgi:dCMP deaminase